LPNCVYLFIAETAMLNTYPQKSLERRVFLTDRFAKSHQKNANPLLLLWPSTRIFKADEAVKQHHLQSRQVVQQTNCRAAPIFRTQCGRVKRAFPSSALIQPERVWI
jgi:hypothetical protein